MAKVSVVIPSRDEVFLEPTIHDIFRNRRGECEVIAVLDSEKWPAGWRELVAEFPDLHTIHNGQSIGMRGSINKGVASAKSRGAKFIMKTDGHCSFSEGFDVTLAADCDKDWVVVPRRGRLDPENWVATDTHKPDIDYHYLSFPDDPADFGGPGLNGKVWEQRAVERKDVLIDEEMSSQGSCWFMHTDYFYALELMDEAAWGPFWAEFQEIGFHCWLSGGKVMVNKKAKYLHLHKGKKYGRGYRLAESALKMGRNQAMKYLYNEGWAKQTLPFKSLIDRFAPVPTWPENWEELVYGKIRATSFANPAAAVVDTVHVERTSVGVLDVEDIRPMSSLKIHAATYGIGGGLGLDTDWDVTERVRSLVKNDALDIVVNNSTLTPDQNPMRGKKKRLLVTYAYDGGELITVQRDEKEWLIIGQAASIKDELRPVPPTALGAQVLDAFEPVSGVKVSVQPEQVDFTIDHEGVHDNLLRPEHGYFPTSDKLLAQPVTVIVNRPTTAAALNDYLIRKFKITDRRLRGPMPIEVREFHRDDLAVLFAELGFRKGAEIGVAEGKYSEVLLKANPECELLLVDPWHAYSDNPQNKTKEKNEFAYNEARRRTQGYNVKLDMRYSMDAVRDVADGSLDFVYCDGNHLFDYAVQDLIEWSKKVRSGGLITGDDYYALDQKRWKGGGVVEAVQAYVNAHQIPTWYIFSGHKSVDFMWVKP